MSPVEMENALIIAAYKYNTPNEFIANHYDARYDVVLINMGPISVGFKPIDMDTKEFMRKIWYYALEYAV